MRAFTYAKKPEGQDEIKVLHFIEELQRPEGPPSENPFPHRKAKETHELIFSWLSWLAVLFVGAYV